MIANLSPLFSSVSGTVGNISFRNSGSTVISRKPNYNIHRSPLQISTRALNILIKNKWNSLSFDQRISWAEPASLYYIWKHKKPNPAVNAYIFFKMVNINYWYTSGGDLFSVPPPFVIPEIPIINDIDIIGSPSIIRVYVDTIVTPDYFIFVYAAPYLSISKTPKANQFRFICYSSGVDNIVNITSEMINNYGQVPETFPLRISVKVKFVSYNSYVGSKAVQFSKDF